MCGLELEPWSYLQLLPLLRLALRVFQLLVLALVLVMVLGLVLLCCW